MIEESIIIDYKVIQIGFLVQRFLVQRRFSSSS